MREQEMGVEPSALTPPLAFGNNTETVPAFLKQGEIGKETGKAEPVEIKEPVTGGHVQLPPDFFEDPASALEPGNPVENIDVIEGLEDIEDIEEIAAAKSETKPKSLDDMSVEELQKQQQEIDRRIAEKRDAEKKAVIDQIVEVVNTYNIPLDELFDALGGFKPKRKGVKATQKYQDPVSGVTWSGRGKEPAWIRGKSRKAFEIDE
jgi:DNA-binding protein H-NS